MATLAFLQKLRGTPVLPDICPACLARRPDRPAGWCAVCAPLLRKLPEPRCALCGGGIDGVLEVCGECLQGGGRLWTHAVSVYEYGGLVRELLHRFKYGKAAYLAPAFAGEMAESWKRLGGGAPDLVTPVPMHWLREAMRGYNQAALLAEEIAAMLNAKMATVARRRKFNRRQVSLGRKGRHDNARAAFAARRPAAIRDRHVLLVDDVFTTGSTLNAVAEVIMQCQPAKLSVLTLARG